MSITRFSFPTTVHFGAGARMLAGPHLAEHGCRRPLIVTRSVEIASADGCHATNPRACTSIDFERFFTKAF